MMLPFQSLLELGHVGGERDGRYGLGDGRIGLGLDEDAEVVHEVQRREAELVDELHLRLLVERLGHDLEAHGDGADGDHVEQHVLVGAVEEVGLDGRGLLAEVLRAGDRRGAAADIVRRALGAARGAAH